MNWYNTLNQPLFTPPSWIFRPAWSFFYLTIFAAFIIFVASKYIGSKKKGYILFFSQLIVNLCWPFVFFYLNDIGLSLFVLILLDILVIFTVIEFYEVSKIAGLILIPYLVWLIFATYLNTGIFILN